MSTVEAVALKLPTFWTSNPEAWFMQVEAQFAIRNITADDTKYYYVVSALDSATATRALSILKSPPASDKYKSIKTFLTSAFGLTDAERATALFKLNGLGDMKPSELMDSMLSLLGTHQPCFLFKHLFLQQLPEYVRTPLATSTLVDCRQLALEADMYYHAGTGPHVDSLVKPKSKPPDADSGGKESNTCWYHWKYGQHAQRCQAPCRFATRKNQGQDQGNSQQGRR